MSRIANDTEARVRYSDFIMASAMPTHYTNATGKPIAIETHVHLLRDYVTSGLAAGWTLVEMKERGLALARAHLRHRDVMALP